MEDCHDHQTQSPHDLGIVRSEHDDFTVLETAPHIFTAAPTNQLLPATPQDIAFDFRMELTGIIERARLFGVPDDALRGLLDEELRVKE